MCCGRTLRLCYLGYGHRTRCLCVLRTDMKTTDLTAKHKALVWLTLRMVNL